MRHVVTRIGEPIELRADEIDWMPTNFDYSTWHLLVNDEDLQSTKHHKLLLRKANRRAKLNSKYQ